MIIIDGVGAIRFTLTVKYSRSSAIRTGRSPGSALSNFCRNDFGLGILPTICVNLCRRFHFLMALWAA
jgi:hypothetical protein